MAARRRQIVLLVAALLQGAANAATPTVTWVTPELSADTNNFGDHYLSFLMGRLPGFDHRVLHGSIGRVWHEIQSSHVGACVFNALKTPEREKVAEYSRRPLLTRAFRFYFPESRREGLAPYFDAEGRIDLGKLTEAPLRGGVTANRSYNAAIDGFIATRRKGRPLDGLVSTRQLINLLRAGRLDFAFASPIDFNENQEGVSSVPVAGAEAWDASFIACNRDKTGLSVIATVDRLFDDQENWAEFIEPLRTVLSDEDYAVALRSKP
ncbi:MAG TPA: hypothetical protein VKP60_03230 [Magnetospirillaceae bacterium]|nr:hypothetical protein [Magnetospirillaceae bacterium]